MLKELVKSAQKLSSDKEQFDKTDSEGTGLAIAVIVILVVWILLVLFVGKSLWNGALVPATNLKKSYNTSILGDFFIDSTFIFNELVIINVLIKIFCLINEFRSI